MPIFVEGLVDSLNIYQVYLADNLNRAAEMQR